MCMLSPEEIRILSKVDGRTTDDPVYVKRYPEAVEKLCACGYISVGTRVRSLASSDMATLRSLLKAKGIKAGGKKAELAERVMQHYSEAELEDAEVPVRYILSDQGKELVEKNSALLYYFDAFGGTGILDPERIISEQSTSTEDDLGLLIRLFSEQTDIEKSNGRKRAIIANLSRLYTLKNDESHVEETRKKIEYLDQLIETEKRKEGERLNSILGISEEERQRIYQKVRNELDDKWEKELDAKNRAKAGIEE